MNAQWCFQRALPCCWGHPCRRCQWGRTSCGSRLIDRVGQARAWTEVFLGAECHCGRRRPQPIISPTVGRRGPLNLAGARTWPIWRAKLDYLDDGHNHSTLNCAPVRSMISFQEGQRAGLPLFVGYLKRKRSRTQEYHTAAAASCGPSEAHAQGKARHPKRPNRHCIFALAAASRRPQILGGSRVPAQGYFAGVNVAYAGLHIGGLDPADPACARAPAPPASCPTAGLPA